MEHADNEYISSVAEDQQIYLRDGIATVSSDGEPHGYLIMVAVFSGIFVAFCILLLLGLLIDRRKIHKQHNTRLSIFTIFGNSRSFDIMSKTHQTCISVDLADTFSKCKHNRMMDDAKFRVTPILPDITTISC